jgi:uncharacterized protein with PIN domain
MKTAHIRFYEELNDFLPKAKRKVRYELVFTGTPAVKDIIESQGAPHTEIDMILANGKSVRFNYKLKEGDDISVYPEFESFDISKIQKLRPKPLRHPKFVLDVHLGTLAKYMRMLGFDVKYRNDFSDGEIIEISLNEKRAILTRDLGILKQGKVTRGYWVRSVKAAGQVREIIGRFDLSGSIKEFSRCIRCNTLLKPIDKEKVIQKLPSKVKACREEFYYCRECNKIYWKGSHYEKMREFIEKLKEWNNQ